MPNGEIHAQAANKAAFALCTTSIIGAVLVHPLFVGVAVGGLVGCIVDPDLDHEWRTQSEQRVRRFNPVVGLLWSAYWSPYDWAHPHRGTSHTWPYGTLVRFVYALWPLLIVSVFLAHWAVVLAWWSLVFVGLSVQDCLHLYMDEVL